MTTIRAGVLAACLSLAGSAMGQNLFVITASSGGQTQAIGADNIIDLVSDAVNNANQFSFLGTTGQSANLALNYGGVQNAIIVDKDATNSTATLSFLNPDGSRTVRNFDVNSPNANGRSLEDLITDYLKQDGSSDLKKFFQAMNALTPIAVSDGNPNSTTARLADAAYLRFGFHNNMTAITVDPTDRASNRAGTQFRVDAVAKTFDAGDFSGETINVSSSLDFNAGKSWGISIGSHLGFNTVGDANILHLGITGGLPIRLCLPSESTPLTWQVTPFAALAGSASEDVGAGGLVYSFGVTNSLTWHLTPKLELSMANQFGAYEGTSLSFGDFEIDPGVSNQLVKNGGQALYRLGDEWYVFAGATYSNFLEDASVEGWLTPSLGVGFRNDAGTGFQANFTGDFGDDYTAYGVRLGLNLAF
jgi:hypothetical protein